jgi:hypothetical protein
VNTRRKVATGLFVVSVLAFLLGIFVSLTDFGAAVLYLVMAGFMFMGAWFAK